MADILIIDEISMISGKYIDRLDALLKIIRESMKPFGGLKIILCGDFYQLPPVSQGGEIDYAFASESWERLSLVNCLLDEQHRQKQDALNELLVALRDRKFSKHYLDILTARQGLKLPQTTMLLTHNSDVDKINIGRLESVKGKSFTYKMRYEGDKQAGLKLASNILSPSELILKVGAKVMFTANDFATGYVNGSQGIVVSFKSGLPVVELETNSKRITVETKVWKYSAEGKTEAEVYQLPLRLAWAITIHKSLRCLPC